MPLDLRPRPGLGLWSHLLAADTQALPARTLGPCSPPSVRKLIVGTCPLQPSGHRHPGQNHTYKALPSTHRGPEPLGREPNI